MRVLICTYPTPNIKEVVDIKYDDYIIGVDQAIDYLYDQNIKVDLAVGDFDSLKNQDVLKTLTSYKLPKIKDVTDTHQALLEAMKLNPSSIMILGGIGGVRIEHFIAITLLFDVYPKLVIKNENSTLFILNKCVHEIRFDGYISIFAYQQATITLKHFNFDIENYDLTYFDPLCISNELSNNVGKIEIISGRVLVIFSKKEN